MSVPALAVAVRAAGFELEVEAGKLVVTSEAGATLPEDLWAAVRTNRKALIALVGHPCYVVDGADAELAVCLACGIPVAYHGRLPRVVVVEPNDVAEIHP